MSEIRSCGVLVFRRKPSLSFLLMQHKDRWDLPKGHVDSGESDFECAMRELQEETGIEASEIEIDERFNFETEYIVRVKRFKFQPRTKSLRMYLGWLKADRDVELTEHVGFEWWDWSPPHQIQPETIDDLLARAAEHFSQFGVSPL